MSERSEPSKTPGDGETSEGGEAMVREEPTVTRAVADGRERHFPCRSCGSQLEVAPGATVLRCLSCGATEEVPLTAAAITEKSLNEYVPPIRKKGFGDTGLVAMRCAGCGATVQAPPNTVTVPCAYCGGHLEGRSTDEDAIQPDGVVPFRLDQQAAERAVRTWISKLWFAPSDLKNLTAFEVFRDCYLPYFTFDTHTCSHYEGEAGEHYYVTVGSGKNRRQVRRTRWYWRSGVHEQFFDDYLIPASPTASGDERWNTGQAKPYQAALLAGTTTRCATIRPDAGWRDAKRQIEAELYATCKRRIGGDEQRRVSVVTAHSGVTWKLLLVPRWEGGFRYRKGRFVLSVNGQNGVVKGDRPWSVWKITAAVLLTLLIVGCIALAVYFNERRPRHEATQFPSPPPSQMPEPLPEQPYPALER
jgi:predicted RNA-binding Zn-ribbon protein involved in translation (DUF1610 family)